MLLIPRFSLRGQSSPAIQIDVGFRHAPHTKEASSMSSDQSALRAIDEAAGYVRDTIRHFTDVERKRILEIALRELDSKLLVRDGS
jgi:hypothetical protein